MGAVFGFIALHFRHFHHVIGDEGGQTSQAEELVGFVKRQIHAIHAHAVEKLLRVGKRLQGRIPRQRQHIGFAL